MSDNPITIHVYNRLPDELVHPCDLGLHLWAWLTAGGQQCYRCGVMR